MSELELEAGEQVLWWERRRPGLRASLRMAAFPLYLLLWGGFSLLKYANTSLFPQPDFASSFLLVIALLHASQWIGMASMELTVTTHRIVLTTPGWSLSAAKEQVVGVETYGDDLVLVLDSPAVLQLKGLGLSRFFSPRLPFPRTKPPSMLPAYDVGSVEGLLTDLRREAVLPAELETKEHPGASRSMHQVLGGVLVFLSGGVLLLANTNENLIAIALILVGAVLLHKSDDHPWTVRLAGGKN